MNNAALVFVLSQLGYQAPILLVYLAAFVLALAYLGRTRGPAILTLSGIAVLVLSTLAATAIQAYLIHARGLGGRDPAGISRLMQIVGIAGSLIRAAGTSLLIAAIFTGRRSAGDQRE